MIDLRHRAAPCKRECELEVGQHVREHVAHAGLSGERETVRIGATDPDGARAERDGAKRVGTTPHAAIHEHGHTTRHRVDHGGECVERTDTSVHLPPPVIGDEDTIHSRIHGKARVVRMENALQDDGQARAPPEKRQIGPGERRSRIGRDEASHRGGRRARAQIVRGTTRDRARHCNHGAQRGECHPSARGRGTGQRLGELAHEDGIAGVLRDALADHEREVRLVEVSRAPTEHRGIQRDNERFASARLGAAHEAFDELVVLAPVQLEPSRCVTHRGRASFHRHGCLIREDHRKPARGSGTRDRRIRLRVHQFEHADGR